MVTQHAKPRTHRQTVSVPSGRNIHQVIDALEKEQKKLQARFNRNFSNRGIYDVRSRYLCILAICRTGLLCRSIRAIAAEKQINDMKHEFFKISNVLNAFFDSMESRRVNKKKNRDDTQHIAAGR